MMNQREQDFLNKIDEATRDVKIPESLEPKEIERMLESRPKKMGRRKLFMGGLAAACCLLVCGAAYGISRTGVGTDRAVVEETALEADDLDFQTAENYEDIYGYLEESLNAGTDYGEEIWMGDSAAGGSAKSASEAGASNEAMALSAESSASAGDYSETNVRQQGVDEADVVKTDGRYLYTLRDNGRSVSIVDTAEGELKEVGEVEVQASETVSEFYVTDGKLVLVGTRYGESRKSGGGYAAASYTFAVTYDLKDPEEPEKTGEVTQSGDYNSSRMSGGHLYLFSRYYVYGEDITAKDTRDYIPLINDELVPANDIFLPDTDCASMYQVISSVDMERPDRVKDSKAVFADAGELYVSGSHIYWYERQWGYHTRTVIRSISYKDGELAAKASGSVAGYIHDSFCIDEYQDYLRVITTHEDSNSVYVLDKELEIVGSITGLAEDERVYSARLLGDVGYFVTYKETDPLFSVDFSDPKNPKIIGELKIPGFSEYLHFYGEDQLLGIGMDVDEDGFTTNGVKLSLFDISDNTDVREVQKYVMENVYSADVMYDYRAALIDEEKNIIGFSAYSGEGERYYVFECDESQGFRCLMDEAVNGNGYQTARGVYIDDTLYVVKGNIIEAYSMEDYKKTDDIIL